MSEIKKDEEKENEKNISRSSRQVSTDKSIKDTEKKFKFEEYDRKKFDTNAKQRTKENQFANGEKQFDPISGEEIVLTQEEAKQRWGDDWAKHSAEGDHIDPLERVYEKGKGKAFVKEEDVKEIANQDSNFIAISKETNTRKGNRTNEELVHNPKNNYSEQGEKNALELQKKAEKINDEELKKRNISGAKDTLKTSATNAAMQAGTVTGVMSGVHNAKLVKEGKKSKKEAVEDTAKDTVISSGKAAVVSTSSTMTQAAKHSKSKILKNVAKYDGFTVALQGVVEVGPDLYKAAISKSISWTQLGKNFSVFAAGVAGAKLGAMGGAAAGAKVGAEIGTFVEPGTGTAAGTAIGTTVGGTAGSIAGGVAGAKAAKALTDAIAKDDAVLMTEVMNQRVAELADIYDLSVEEFEKSVLPKIQKKVDGKWLVEMFKYSGRDDEKAQVKFVDKELIQFFEEDLEKKNVFKRIFISLKTIKLKKAYGLNVKPFIRILIAMFGIFICLALITLILLLSRSCSARTKESPQDYAPVLEVAANNTEDIIIEEINTEEINTRVIGGSKIIVLPETKSFEFRADRRDYVNNADANEWCDKIAVKINEELLKNPGVKFIIKGYVAHFDNEIDEETLALERSMKIKSELIKRDVPEENLIAVSGGVTNRWGDERKLNRAVTIESVED